MSKPHESITATGESFLSDKNDVLESDEIIVPLGLDALQPSFNLKEALSAKGVELQGDVALSPEQRKSLQAPVDWTQGRKAAVLAAPFVAGLLAAYSAGSYSLASEQLRDLWDVSYTEYNIGITIFVSGFAFAPVIMAPVSEAHGRYGVFVGAGVVFFLGTLGCALTPSYAGMLVSRFVTGTGASIYATLTGGVVSDLYDKEDRNTPMTLYSLNIIIGTGLGPLVSGLLVTYIGWRWIFYLQLILIGLTTLAIALFFSETRSNVVLRRKCAALNSLYSTSDEAGLKQEALAASNLSRGRTTVFFQPEGEKPKFNVATVLRSFTFPLKLLTTEPIVFWFSAWVSFAWAILYLQFVSIGIVFRDVYDFNSAQVGAVYTAVVVGSVFSALACSMQDIFFRKRMPVRMATPEGRLLSSCLLSILLPAGLFIFGWTANPRISWVVPTIAIGFCTVGIFSIYLAVFNYIADTYQRYSSSAQAAQSMCRNLLAGIFPLIGDVILRNLGYGGAGSLLGALGLLLTGIPWLLLCFGERIRARSSFAGSLAAIEVK
ncbi:putative MFS multidrug transporter [Rosellinia necatrix]|uniref:Putative MFS multidrug transporter n=1 Tax=Rosellinia necatrix TaxID=77044 RepID=A0A1W2TQZ1_ROSNE|nr:putative MFS multidrug transporter [Rosellinia necatrix]